MINKFILTFFNIVKKKGNILLVHPDSYLIWNKIKLSGIDNQLIVNGKGKFRKCKIIIKGKNNTIKVEDSANISFSTLEIVGNNCLIQIGKNTDIGGAYLSAKGESINLTIGESCMFSRDINIMTYDGHPIYDADSGRVLNSPKSINIGNNVWIAAGASILKGVTVSDSSIIAFGSIVTHDVQEKTIVAGSPAKTIRKNIRWEH